MTLTEKIKQVDIVAVVQSSGLELRECGSKHFCRCPFHADTSPSLVIYQDNRWWCFGCNIGGDAVDFVQKLHRCDFKEACRHCGIEPGNLTNEDRRRIADLEQKRIEVKQQRQHESDLAYSLGTMIRLLRSAMAGITPKIFEQYGQIIDDLAYMEYAHETLINGSSDEKHECVKAFQDFPLIERNRIFDPVFDFTAWLRNFIYGEANGRKQSYRIANSKV